MATHKRQQADAEANSTLDPDQVKETTDKIVDGIGKPVGAKKRGRPKKNSISTQIPVSYGNVSIGEATCRIGISVARENMDVTQADQQLCGKRLSGRMLARPNGVQAGQEPIPGMEDGDLSLPGLFDVKSFSVTGKSISAGLTFALASTDVGVLSHFAKREGILSIDSVEEIPDEAEEGDDEE